MSSARKQIATYFYIHTSTLRHTRRWALFPPRVCSCSDSCCRDHVWPCLLAHHKQFGMDLTGRTTTSCHHKNPHAATISIDTPTRVWIYIKHSNTSRSQAFCREQACMQIRQQSRMLLGHVYRFSACSQKTLCSFPCTPPTRTPSFSLPQEFSVSKSSRVFQLVH